MTESEGVIRYQLDYRRGPLPTSVVLDGLRHWFRRCRERALIGQDPARYAGYAYGNISLRASPGFVISGTQTGGCVDLGPDQLAWVESWDTRRNRVAASGPARPSSEALTHGQIYATLQTVDAVIHVHSASIWRRARELGLPCTAPTAEYGTPQMAAEVDRLLRQHDDSGPGILAMLGHEDGIVAYGPTIDSAGELLFSTLQRASTPSRPGDPE